jgi:YesN/AraC family two-component response regulator
VDDESEAVYMLSLILSKFFKNVFTTTNPKEGIDIFIKEKIDMVITDLKMPEIDGIEFSKLIKNYDKETPVIVLTAYTKTEDMIELIKTGVNNYLVKPIDEQTLFSVLQTEIEKLHNKEFYEKFKNHEIIQTLKEQIESIVIDLLEMCPVPMFAENDEIFYINNACFNKYNATPPYDKFEKKELCCNIKVYKEKC